MEKTIHNKYFPILSISSVLVNLFFLSILSAQEMAEADFSPEGNFERAEKVSDWIVENGILKYSRYGDDKLQFMLDTDSTHRAGINPIDMAEDGMPYYFRVVLSTPSTYYRIINLTKLDYNGELYEFWIIKKNIDKEISQLTETHCQFYVTKTNNFFSEREILKKEAYFFDSYPIDVQNTFAIPIDDPKFQYRLEAWDHTDCYSKDQKELTDYITYPVSPGAYAREPYTLLLRLQRKLEAIRSNII